MKVKVIVDALASKIPPALQIALDRMGTDARGNKNIELRYYNPASLNPKKWTHRDHSKMLIVDSEILLTGGRNVGDKYFGINVRRNFTDLDILLRGTVAQTARANFLQVWDSNVVRDPKANSQFSTQLDPAICTYSESESGCLQNVATAENEVKNQTNRLEKLLKEILLPENDDLVKSHTGNDWWANSFITEKVQFLSHKPDELVNAKNAFLSHSLFEALKNAKKEVYIVSPYLIPTPLVMQTFRQLVERGVKVRLVTNSINSTDNLMAQAGYRYRKDEMVKIGVEIHEYVGPDTLHAKAAVIDRKTIVVCTCNLDPRSAVLNREVGIVIGDADINGLAMQLEGIIDIFRNRSILVAKNKVEHNREAQLAGVSSKKRKLVNALLLAMPVLINQL